MIEISNLGKKYVDESGTTEALREVNFSVKKGEFVSIMGPSGSGKSTLLHILSFLDRPTGGKYLFAGKSINDLNDVELAQVRNKEMGFVFQSFNLMARSSVYENVELPLLYSDTPKEDRKKLIDKALASVGLTDKALQVAGTLSGGQKQRVAIARALVNDPNVIFADEPTGNLDSKSGFQVMEILKGLHDGGRTVILVTHETKTAEYGKRLIRIKDGTIEVDEKINGHIRSQEVLK